MLDEFYTPSSLAQIMIDAVPKKLNPKSVADFAAGGGALLTSALEIWPEIGVIANDLSNITAQKLSKLHPSWSVSCFDFLNEKSLSRSKCFPALGKIDLILINPPFSQRGKKLIESNCSDYSFLSGTAVAFLYRSLAYLSQKGCLIAILPDSCFTSQRDKQAWTAIRKNYTVDFIRENPCTTFAGVTAKTSIIRIQPLNGKTPLCSIDLRSESIIDIHRGSLPMHLRIKALGKHSAPLVHTSNLKKGGVLIDQSITYTCTRTFTGPGILFPRVGRISPEKICILPANKKVVLSDCVLATPCQTIHAAIQLQSTIIQNWEIFSKGYCGTGAPFITIERAKQIIGLCLDKQNEQISSEETLLAA
jgi:hypothetical protein